MVVQGQGLDERIVLSEMRSEGFGQLAESLSTLFAALGAAVAGSTEQHVLVAVADLPRRTVVVIAPRHDAAEKRASFM